MSHTHTTLYWFKSNRNDFRLRNNPYFYDFNVSLWILILFLYFFLLLKSHCGSSLFTLFFSNVVQFIAIVKIHIYTHTQWFLSKDIVYSTLLYLFCAIWQARGRLLSFLQCIIFTMCLLLLELVFSFEIVKCNDDNVDVVQYILSFSRF